MNPEYLLGRMEELDAQIECEEDATCAVRLIRERLDLLNVLLSLQDQEKAESA